MENNGTRDQPGIATITTVLLVDDHPMVRAGLCNLIATAEDLLTVGEAADGQQAVTMAGQLTPDVILMDLSMPGMDGVEATRRIMDDHPEIRVVVLTSFAGRARVSEALAAGAVGYLLKDCEPGEILAAIRSAKLGHAPVDARVARVLLPSATPQVADTLSARELDVLRLVAKGLPNKQIGGSLGISEQTVKVHVGNIFRRLGVADRASAALWAHDHVVAQSA
jgi:DNA-binding NarL/FixJ family response regulator